MTNRHVSLVALCVAGAETMFWLYTFYYIEHRTNPLGDGMEWLAEVPVTMIVLGGVVPAVLLAMAGFWYRWAGNAGALFAVGALIADVVVWSEIPGEFANKVVH